MDHHRYWSGRPCHLCTRFFETFFPTFYFYTHSNSGSLREKSPCFNRREKTSRACKGYYELAERCPESAKGGPELDEGPPELVEGRPDLAEGHPEFVEGHPDLLPHPPLPLEGGGFRRD